MPQCECCVRKLTLLGGARDAIVVPGGRRRRGQPAVHGARGPGGLAGPGGRVGSASASRVRVTATTAWRTLVVAVLAASRWRPRQVLCEPSALTGTERRTAGPG